MLDTDWLSGCDHVLTSDLVRDNKSDLMWDFSQDCEKMS